MRVINSSNFDKATIPEKSCEAAVHINGYFAKNGYFNSYFLTKKFGECCKSHCYGNLHESECNYFKN